MKLSKLLTLLLLCGSLNLTAQRLSPQPEPNNVCGSDCYLHCSDFDTQIQEPAIVLPTVTSGEEAWHLSGDHYVDWGPTDSCLYDYSGPCNDGVCDCSVLASSSVPETYWEEHGTVSYYLNGGWHAVGWNQTAVSSGRGYTSNSQGAAAEAIEECYSDDPTCTYTSIAWSGLTPTYITHPGTSDPGFVVANESAESEYNPCPFEQQVGTSPIAVDMESLNFEDAFTDATHGVYWAYAGHAKGWTAWTNPKRQIAFLVLPEEDGSVRTLKDFFGNLTNQRIPPEEVAGYEAQVAAAAARGEKPPVYARNGFNALKLWDTAPYGGNGDGKITPADKVWSKLRLWINTEHDAVWPHGKVLTLDEAGWKSISLTYTKTDRKDSYGNQFRFMGTVELVEPSNHIPQIADVFLVTTN